MDRGRCIEGGMKIPVPSFRVRIAILVVLAVTLFWFAGLDRLQRDYFAFHFLRSGYGRMLLFPLPIGFIAMLLAWNAAYFRKGYFVAAAILAVFEGAAFIGGHLAEIPLEHKPPVSQFDAGAGIAAGVLVLLVWSGCELFKYCQDALISARLGVASSEPESRIWWATPFAAACLVCLSYANFTPPPPCNLACLIEGIGKNQK
ncbi:MAG: hypothetical protein CTY15_12200 [Methylocystis sp.]|nr:MAG: hypothetical protein CTY15_12200 [Methylocystis sp.]